MHLLKRFAVTIVGFALLVIGALLMVLPGPGILLIVAGFAVLATEYVWARRLLRKARQQATKVQEAAVASPVRTAGSVAFALVLVAIGVAMLLVDDVPWPILDSILDRVWGTFTGAVLIATGLILLTTTYITARTAKGQETTYTPDPQQRPGGATRYDYRTK
jgi:uncharacterized protein (TIGR02611 family)